jgi:hypothetical protein
MSLDFGPMSNTSPRASNDLPARPLSNKYIPGMAKKEEKPFGQEMENALHDTQFFARGNGTRR